MDVDVAYELRTHLPKEAEFPVTSHFPFISTWGVSGWSKSRKYLKTFKFLPP